MLKILINAYACSPGMGSEPGMAWNWCVNLAKFCELHVITEGEFKGNIESTMQFLPQAKNMHFYYSPIPENVRRMCWNQGNWGFYKYYKDWQWKTYRIAKNICGEKKIDILHQLNMIGFREPGYLWRVSRELKIPFVWGPIGGLKQFPMAYAIGGSLKMKVFLRLKNFLNVWQLKNDSRVDAAIRQASLLISSIPDSYNAIKKYKRKESVIIPETGTFVQEDFVNETNRFTKDSVTILWVGKFDFRKRLDLAIAIVSQIKNSCPQIILKIYGTGNQNQIDEVKSLAQQMDAESIIQWMGNCPNEQVTGDMRSADIFLFTSVNEDTSTVVLEAIGNHLPVLCFDTCGMAHVINDEVGIKIPLTNPQQSVKDFAEKIKNLYHHREVLERMSQNCRKRAEELSWENKAKQMVELYEKVVQQKSNERC